MKRIISIAVAVVMLISVLSFTACGTKVERTQIDDIYGMTPEEAYSVAMTYIAEDNPYQVNIGMDIAFDLKIMQIPVEIPELYIYAYKDGNSHHLLTESGEAFLAEESLSSLVGSLFEGIDKESWFVDGLYYRQTLNGEYLVSEAEQNPISSGVLEEAADTVISEYIQGATCYESEEGVFVEIVLTDDDTLLGTFPTEIYRVYFNDNGTIDKITVTGEVNPISMTATLNYSYDVEDITAPENAEEFTFVD